MIISDYSCSVSFGKTISVTFENKGLFDVEGFYIKATNKSDQDIATISLVKGPNEYVTQKIRVGANYSRDFDYSNYGNIYQIEVTPFRYEKVNERDKFAFCGNAKIIQKLQNC